MLGREKFVKKAQSVHGSKYDYSEVAYQGAHKKVAIICPDHGPFDCTPVNHWSNGVGCPKCLYSNPSRGEAKIAAWLTEHNIQFECQKAYPDLWYKAKNGRLKYDFYIPSNNLLIEYDGEHHSLPITWSKRVDGHLRLKEQIIKDKLKTDYAIRNSLGLLRISYLDKVEEILNQYLSS